MRVAVFGGTGFIGEYLTETLVEKGHEPVLLVRHGSEKKLPFSDRCVIIHGSVNDPESVKRTLRGCNAAIYLIGIIREIHEKGITFKSLHYEGVVTVADAALKEGVKRFIHMSANGASPEGAPYQQTKYLAEEYLKKSGLNWTIIRPSLVFGGPHGKFEFCTMVKKQIIMPPLPAPLFYQGILPLKAGSFLLGPVHVKNVASVFTKSLEMEEASCRTFSLCGHALEWKELLKIIAEASGRKKLMLPVPVLPVMLAAKLFDRFGFFPVTRGQLKMLIEGNYCDSEETFMFFREDVISFNVENLKYLRD
jgi:uncharacterized protein YbjT (DUF2867 family)